jgi:hypothetical protein
MMTKLDGIGMEQKVSDYVSILEQVQISSYLNGALESRLDVKDIQRVASRPWIRGSGVTDLRFCLMFFLGALPHDGCFSSGRLHDSTNTPFSPIITVPTELHQTILGVFN